MDEQPIVATACCPHSIAQCVAAAWYTPAARHWMTFVPFDPLEFKNTKVNDAALSALKREIENILSSYVGWYDPFCELIQNALDAVEARVAIEKSAGTKQP